MGSWRQGPLGALVAHSRHLQLPIAQLCAQPLRSLQQLLFRKAGNCCRCLPLPVAVPATYYCVALASAARPLPLPLLEIIQPLPLGC